MFCASRRINLPYFFAPAFQFTTTVKGGGAAAMEVFVATRKRFPSVVTSYCKPVPGAAAMWESNSGARAKIEERF
jgi:hypothetical protein